MSVLENEYLFILVCPYYRELRNNNLPKYIYVSSPTKQKFVQLLKFQSTIVMRKMANFTYEAFIYRKKET